jgi:hypothetical protein
MKQSPVVLPMVTLGGAEGIRTPDLLLAKQALSRLSYSPNANYCIKCCVVAKALSFLNLWHSCYTKEGMIKMKNYTAYMRAWMCRA